jgi:hypothetical protein
MMDQDFVSPRSYAQIDGADLRRLSEAALKDLSGLFARRAQTGERYRERLLMLCLCQGGAEHFVRHNHGVKDFDVWAFFSRHPDGKPFPYRRRGKQDFGPSRFGRHPDDHAYLGRRIDILGRSIECDNHELAAEYVRMWLSGKKSDSAKLIAQRPVVVIDPLVLRGTILWDPISA